MVFPLMLLVASGVATLLCIDTSSIQKRQQITWTLRQRQPSFDMVPPPNAEQYNGPDPPNQLSSENVQEVAGRLRDLRAFLQHSADPAAAAHLEHLCRSIEYMDNVADAYRSRSLSLLTNTRVHREHLSEGRSYTTKSLIDMFAASNLVVSDHLLSDTICAVLRLVLPEDAAGECIARLKDRHLYSLPSQPTMSRARLVLDAGFMIMKQNIHKTWLGMFEIPEPGQVNRDAVALYESADKSPLMRREWLFLEEHQWTRPARLTNAMERIMELRAQHPEINASLPNHELSHEESTELLEAREEITVLTKSMVEDTDYWIYPMSGMGSQRADVANTVHAVVHTKLLEHGDFDTLKKTSRFVVSWTSDLGTEHDIPRIGNFNLDDAFPHWARHHGDAEHAAFDLGSYEPPPAPCMASVDEEQAFEYCGNDDAARPDGRLADEEVAGHWLRIKYV